MGNFMHFVAPGVSYIASDATWIESNAVQQLITTAQLPGMTAVAGMPDLHPGRGYPVGAAFFSEGRFYPALVGNDIGCGMALWQTELTINKLNADKAEKQLLGMTDHADAAWLADHVSDQFADHPFAGSLSSIGGGNHFAEFQQIDQIADEALFAASGLDKRRVVLLVHSGSRGLGQMVLRQHVDQFNHDGLAENTPAAADYLAAHQQALEFAQHNRELIALRMMQQLRTQGNAVLDVNHNLVEACTLNGRDGWLHRKGATPVHHDFVVIPGSRGDYSYLVKPHPMAESLYSLAHGAGRKWMRTECKGRLSHRYTPVQLSRTSLGSRVICANKQLIYEEAPQSYKSIETVIESLLGTGLITVVARLKPLLTYKTSGEHC